MTSLDDAWTRYRNRITAAGEGITGASFPDDPRLRAEGYRYVERLSHLAWDIYVEFASTTRPALFRYGDDTSPFGATNVDNNYYRAMLDPAGSYVVRGDVTGVKELLFSVQDGEFVYGNRTVLSEVGLDDLDIGADGQLELHLGGPQRERNWLPLPDGTQYLNVRSFIADWETDGLAELSIERLDPVGPPEELSAEALEAALDLAARWVEASVVLWNQYAGGAKATTPINEISPPSQPPGSAESMLHGGVQWDLAAYEALLLEFEPPQATYWGVQTYIIDWMVPLDFTNRVTSLNDGQLAVDEDGKVRVVIAATDPGVQNWLDTSGLARGLASYRYVKPKTQPAPTSKVVPLATVRDHLPSSTPAYTTDDRREQVSARQRGIARRFRR